MSEQVNIPTEFSPREDLGSLQMKAWIVGGIGLAAIVAGYFTAAPEDFHRAYLVGWLFCLSMPVGLLALTMLGHVSGGMYGVMMRKVAEAAGRTLPVLFVLGIPVALNLEVLYPWARPEVLEHDTLVQHKASYLNADFFYFRAVIYFVFWTAMAFLLSSKSRKYDETGDPAILEGMKKMSAFGLVFHVLLSTFAAVDWVMSLDPHWFSSLMGAAFVEGQVLSAFCFSVLVLTYVRTRSPFDGLIQTKIFHDYGKLMLAFIAVWAYFSFSQFLIIWSGDLPEEVTWYLARSKDGWETVSRLVILGHFVIPFILLLSADLKKKPQLLSGVALWILAMRWLDYFWLVAPSIHPEGDAAHHGVHFGWLDVAAPIGLVGLWLALLIGQFKGRPPVPHRHPMLQEVANHG